ncbi:hypothetical protein SBD_6210 [Streptomyces bottropensis ATCC 25435]|uniref:Uncharacterized protein n=1 Tax=Streptomyces bottropensis ATCC 25435 TaxID=1054862 RepID=M3FJM4_9ACTN|nr:hypothetical protein SBD_6210 [Streptomyces bottropensis ATCC 25435]
MTRGGRHTAHASGFGRTPPPPRVPYGPPPFLTGPPDACSRTRTHAPRHVLPHALRPSPAPLERNGCLGEGVYGCLTVCAPVFLPVPVGPDPG